MKIKKEVLTIIILALVGVMNGIGIPILFDNLGREQIAFLKSEYMVSILLLMVVFVVIIYIIYRITRIKNDLFLIEFKHGKEQFFTIELCSLLSVLALFFSLKMGSYVLMILMVFFILICVNSMVTLKIKNGINDLFVVLNGKRYKIEQIETLDIVAHYATFKVSTKFLFMRIIEDFKVVILEDDAEKLKQLIEDKGLIN